jgi:Immunoglobulin domain/Galactose oxidase, central domain
MKSLIWPCVGAAFMLLTTRASPQCSWQQIHTDQPTSSQGAAMAYDAARGRCVVFGQSLSVFEWNGSQWRLNVPVNNSDALASAPGAMAYDAARSQIVLVPNGAGVGLAETWVFNGARWMRPTVGGPPNRQTTTIAYDSARGRVVLFGGGQSGMTRADTWEWDGSSWLQRTVSGPPARMLHSMAYDSARGRVVLFGGVTSSGSRLGDTWEWNGSAWTQRQVVGPSPRYSAFMAFDSAHSRIVLFGGTTTTDQSDTWEWDGAAWTSSAVAGPAARYGSTMAFDSVRGRTVLFGGARHGTGDTYVDTWEWNGTAWTQVGPSDPSPRFGASLSYDSDLHRTTLFGGRDTDGNANSETWFWSGSVWTRGPVGPWTNSSEAMAYDQARHEHVLFGGYGNDVGLADTWVLSGTTWTQRLVAGPPPRWEHAMAYDSRRQRVVLFGGRSGYPGSTYYADTWEWDGSSWTQAAAQGPPARSAHAMTYDPRLRRVVLVGGWTSAGGMNDTWEWDGFTWTQGAPFAGSESLTFATIAFDSVTQRSVVYKGNVDWTTASMWDYDGAIWRLRVSDAGIRHVASPMVFDTARSRFVLFGGYGNSNFSHNDTLELPAGTNPISITTQPADQTIRNGQTVVFAAAAAGSGPFTYQWWHTDQHGIVDGPGGASGNQPGGFVSGATTSTLTISRAAPADMYEAGTYFCTISNPCTAVSTRTAILTVLRCGSADFNADGDPGTDADIEAFFACLAGNCCASCGSPDFNGDGDYGTDGDIEAFFRVLAGGNC